MNFQVRQCEISDAKAIYELNTSEMGYDYPVEDTIEKIEKLLKSDKDKIFVASIDHKVVGYVHANDYDVIYESLLIRKRSTSLPRNFQCKEENYI